MPFEGGSIFIPVPNPTASGKALLIPKPLYMIIVLIMPQHSQEIVFEGIRDEGHPISVTLATEPIFSMLKVGERSCNHII